MLFPLFTIACRVLSGVGMLLGGPRAHKRLVGCTDGQLGGLK